MEATPLPHRRGIACLPRAVWLEQLPAREAAEEARRLRRRRKPETLMPPAEVVERALRKVRERIRPGILIMMGGSRLIAERGLLPPEPGGSPRSHRDRVRELTWRLEQLAEMSRWNRELFDDVAAGRIPVHKAIMIMTQERGGYAGAFGHLRHRVDAWIQQRTDPNELV